MVNPHKGLVFAGIFVAALALTSFLPRLLQTTLHHHQSLSEADDDSGSATGTPDDAPASGAVSRPAEIRADTSPARILQAVRDSLGRNDLASADVLLRAARALDIDNPQAIALQHDLDARTAKEASSASSVNGTVIAQAAPGAAAPRAAAPGAAAPRAAARTSHAATQPVPKRERPQRAPLRARPQVQTRASGYANIQPEASVPDNKPAESIIPLPQPAAKPDVTVETAPETAPDRVRAPAPVIAAAPVARVMERPAPVPVVESSQGPKSREQVRFELEHARSDGSLPRFGNPDPAGPGVPTISKPLAATQNR